MPEAGSIDCPPRAAGQVAVMDAEYDTGPLHDGCMDREIVPVIPVRVLFRAVHRLARKPIRSVCTSARGTLHRSQRRAAAGLLRAVLGGEPCSCRKATGYAKSRSVSRLVAWQAPRPTCISDSDIRELLRSIS